MINVLVFLLQTTSLNCRAGDVISETNYLVVWLMGTLKCGRGYHVSGKVTGSGVEILRLAMIYCWIRTQLLFLPSDMSWDNFGWNFSSVNLIRSSPMQLSGGERFALEKLKIFFLRLWTSCYFEDSSCDWWSNFHRLGICASVVLSEKFHPQIGYKVYWKVYFSSKDRLELHVKRLIGNAVYRSIKIAAGLLM